MSYHQRIMNLHTQKQMDTLDYKLGHRDARHAAAEIAAEADFEVERLTRELDQMRSMWDKDSAARHRVTRERDEARAALEAMTKAAEAMREGVRLLGVKREPEMYDAVLQYQAALRAALAALPTPPEQEDGS